MPWLVQHFIRNEFRRAAPKSSNRLFLNLGANVMVEDRLRFLMSGAEAILDVMSAFKNDIGSFTAAQKTAAYSLKYLVEFDPGRHRPAI